MKLFFTFDMFETEMQQVHSEDHDVCIGTIQPVGDDWRITSPYHNKALTFGTREAALKNLTLFAAKELKTVKPKIDKQLKLNL